MSGVIGTMSINAKGGVSLARLQCWLIGWMVLALVVITQPAHAERRVALVIGNGAYVRVPRLANPGNDASAMEAMLKGAQFDKVVRVGDLGVTRMRRALRDFSDDVRGADVAVVFYAGHGMEMNGINYLVPVDAVLERDIDVEDETVSLDRVNHVLEQAKRLRLVILDACRDNPFLGSMKRTLSSRSIGRGLARVDVVSSDTLVAYSAKAGSTAADGDAANSPYTSALIKHLLTPGLDVRLALGRVRDEVLRTTNNRQEPFVYGSLGGAELPLVPAAGSEPARGPVTTSRNEAAPRSGPPAASRSVDAKAIVELGHITTRTGDFVRAITAYDEALRLDPNLADGYWARGAAYMNIGEYSRAIVDFDQALRIDAKLVAAHTDRGSAYAFLGDHKRAIVDQDEAIRIDPKYAKAYQVRGVSYANLGDHPRAIIDFDQAIRLDPKNAGAYAARGASHANIGDHDRAIADYSEAIRLDPKHSRAHSDRGKSYAHKGDYTRALEDYRTAIGLDQGDQGAKAEADRLTKRK